MSFELPASMAAKLPLAAMSTELPASGSASAIPAAAAAIALIAALVVALVVAQHVKAVWPGRSQSGSAEFFGREIRSSTDTEEVATTEDPTCGGTRMHGVDLSIYDESP